MNYFLSVVTILLASTNAVAEDGPKPLRQVTCTVTAVDKTPINFLGPVGQFPSVNSKIDLDLSKKTIEEDLRFDPIGDIPLKQLHAVLERSDKVTLEGAGIAYFDGEHVSQSLARYTLAIHVDPQGLGELQIARRGFQARLELYNAILKCVSKE